MRAPTKILFLAVLWSLALRAGPARGAACTVPGTHTSLAAAVADPTCNPITLGAGDFAGSVTVHRSVTISGTGTTTRLRGLPEREVLTLTNNATVQLQGLDLLVHADTLASKAITKAGGSSVSMVNVRIATAAQVAPLPPLDDAIALWNFAVSRINLPVATIYMNLEPVFAVLIGLALGAAASGWQLLGGLVVLAGVLWVQLGDRLLRAGSGRPAPRPEAG